jgi:lipoyl(octanoyl) transferase
MDLAPFARINPCGHEGLQVTQVRELGIDLTVDEVAQQWLPYFARQLGYSLG